MTTRHPRGRPANPEVTVKVLETALMLARQDGVAYATMERISEISGVAKTTLYRRWPSAPAVLMDAFLAHADPQLAYDADKPIVDAVVRVLERLADLGASEDGRLLGALLAAAQGDDELRKAFHDRWVAPRRAQGRDAFATAIERGELASGTDIEMSLDILFGAVYYRLFVSFQPLPRDYLFDLVQQSLVHQSAR